MSSSCPRCDTPLIGASCYRCGWPQGSDADGSFSDDPFFDDPPTDSAYGGSTGPSQDVGDDGVHDIVEGTDSGGLVPDSDRYGSSGPVYTADSASRGSPISAALARAAFGEQLSGRVEHVSEVGYDNASLAAFNTSQQLARGCLTAPFRAVGFLLAILFAPLRFLFHMSMFRQSRAGPDELQVPVRRFRLRTDYGDLVECVLRGQLSGGGIYLGEEVDVVGRFSSTTRVFNVRRLVSRSTGAVTSADVDTRLRFQRLRLVLAIGLVVWLIYVLYQVVT